MYLVLVLQKVYVKPADCEVEVTLNQNSTHHLGMSDTCRTPGLHMMRDLEMDILGYGPRLIPNLRPPRAIPSVEFISNLEDWHDHDGPRLIPNVRWNPSEEELIDVDMGTFSRLVPSLRAVNGQGK